MFNKYRSISALFLFLIQEYLKYWVEQTWNVHPEKDEFFYKCLNCPEFVPDIVIPEVTDLSPFEVFFLKPLFHKAKWLQKQPTHTYMLP